MGSSEVRNVTLEIVMKIVRILAKINKNLTICARGKKENNN